MAYFNTNVSTNAADYKDRGKYVKLFAQPFCCRGETNQQNRCYTVKKKKRFISDHNQGWITAPERKRAPYSIGWFLVVSFTVN